ncbi:hypothetical protein [Streptomyces melanogenes]|uniref:hypothetical protein n=1 Tax=Streptomyces melanogenes TaxID=67326 RepID=UPI00167E2CE1|nr:hypothetical protein [Streptomyces melanogenes]GGP41490.1 hypothetical protein GCM10010278_17940 [Streptomyces melanogenes]
MGWAVLYIAFGVVALWLLGEVLLQYKARLRWRLLAFTGFMGVVLGVLLPSVFVIILGALAFAVGQTYVTLSFRRGFSTGWAVGGRPGASRRRRSGAAAPLQDPVLQVSDFQYEGDGEADAPQDAKAEAADPATAARESVYEPQPLPDDTGQYGVYSENAHAGAQQQYGGYDAGQQQYADPYAGQYGYGTDTGQQQYAAYSDPYIGSGTTQGYGGYDTYAAPQQAYADPYAQQYGMDTPPGGVWVPQQRDNEPQPYGEEQPAPYPQGGEYGNGTGGGTGSGYVNEQQPYRY